LGSIQIPNDWDFSIGGTSFHLKGGRGEDKMISWIGFGIFILILAIACWVLYGIAKGY
jgi:hypothetical protein